MKDLRFDVIGNIDADISFEPDHFEFLLAKFEAEPELGVAGTHYVEGDFHSFRDSYINVDHVNGQMPAVPPHAASRRSVATCRSRAAASTGWR